LKNLKIEILTSLFVIEIYAEKQEII
jgi:hypothetical protein